MENFIYKKYYNTLRLIDEKKENPSFAIDLLLYLKTRDTDPRNAGNWDELKVEFLIQNKSDYNLIIRKIVIHDVNTEMQSILEEKRFLMFSSLDIERKKIIQLVRKFDSNNEIFKVIRKTQAMETRITITPIIIGNSNNESYNFHFSIWKGKPCEIEKEDYDNFEFNVSSS